MSLKPGVDFRRRTLLKGLATACLGLRSGPSLAETAWRIRFSFADQSFTATLLDNPTARSLLQNLPQDLAIEDYSTNEKIIRLPVRLSEEGSAPFANEAKGDLCYYAPWGNLALYYEGYRYSSGLIRLGRLDGGVEPLLKRGRFPVRVERTG